MICLRNRIRLAIANALVGSSWTTGLDPRILIKLYLISGCVAFQEPHDHEYMIHGLAYVTCVGSLGYPNLGCEPGRGGVYSHASLCVARPAQMVPGDRLGMTGNHDAADP